MIRYYVKKLFRDGRVICTGYRRRSRAERAALDAAPAVVWVDAHGRSMVEFLPHERIREMHSVAVQARIAVPGIIPPDVLRWLCG